MGVKISSVAVDLSKESDGDWVDIAEWPGVRLKVRSINYKAFQTAREQRYGKMTKELGRTPYSTEFAPSLAKLAAAFLLLDWEGIDDDADKPIPYSAAKAKEMLEDPAMRGLVEQTIWAASRVGSKDVEFSGDAAKNSD